MKFDELSNKVHRSLWPGLLESAYRQCLAHELHISEISFSMEHPLPVEYKDVKLDCGYRADFLVGENLIVELNSAERLLAVLEAQLLTYMKLVGASVGLLINFNVPCLRQGIMRMVL